MDRYSYWNWGEAPLPSFCRGRGRGRGKPLEAQTPPAPPQGLTEETPRPPQPGHGAVQRKRKVGSLKVSKPNGYGMFLSYMKNVNNVEGRPSFGDLIKMFDSDWKALSDEERKEWKEKAKAQKASSAPMSATASPIYPSCIGEKGLYPKII